MSYDTGDVSEDALRLMGNSVMLLRDAVPEVLQGTVPEPSSLAMFGIGALGRFGYSRRRRRPRIPCSRINRAIR